MQCFYNHNICNNRNYEIKNGIQLVVFCKTPAPVSFAYKVVVVRYCVSYYLWCTKSLIKVVISFSLPQILYCFHCTICVRIGDTLKSDSVEILHTTVPEGTNSLLIFYVFTVQACKTSIEIVCEQWNHQKTLNYPFANGPFHQPVKQI